MSTTKIKCAECNGRGYIMAEADTTATKYGEHIISNSWSKIDNVYIWFQAFKKPSGRWSDIRGYVYETAEGEYYAPFRGDLIKVIKDTRDEFREELNDGQ